MFLECRKPTIAAVNGAAVGIGMDFALLCDIRLASEHAKFSQMFVKLGLMADVTGYWRLPQLVGYAKAAELLFTGDLVGAAEAERIGLVSRVLPADELLPAALDLAGRIAANPPQSVRHIKEGLRRAVGRAVHRAPRGLVLRGQRPRPPVHHRGPQGSGGGVHGEAARGLHRSLTCSTGRRCCRT